jgi:hypothetical protein
MAKLPRRANSGRSPALGSRGGTAAYSPDGASEIAAEAVRSIGRVAAVEHRSRDADRALGGKDHGDTVIELRAPGTPQGVALRLELLWQPHAHGSARAGDPSR